MRALSLLLHGGFATSINVPDGKPITELKLDDLDFDSIITSLGNLDVDDAEKVLDDLLACCSYVPTSGVKTPCTPELVDGFIEDFRVLWKLRVEAFKLNFDFFLSRRPVPDEYDGQVGRYSFLKKYVNVSNMTALVISQRFATLKELETYYSYEDLLDMCEIIYINNINENLMYKDMEKKAKSKN